MRVSAAGDMPLQGLVKPPAKPVVMIKACPEPLIKAVFFFLVQEKPVLVRITSEGPSKENRLEEII